MPGRWCNKERSPVSELSDDLLVLVEIISRVPFKSTCRCKCVSRRWLDLISHPDHRRKLPRSTLAGFFYQNYDARRSPSMHPAYQNVSGSWCAGIDTSLSFFPKPVSIILLDCCNGLLLSRHRVSTDQKTTTVVYMVCNPATQRSVTVPATATSTSTSGSWFARLAFDPDVSSHFHVFEFAPAAFVVDGDMQVDHSRIKAVRIYSSKSRAWTSPVVWDSPISLSNIKGVFSMGLLYLSSFDNFVVEVNLQGNCRAIPAPHSASGDHTLHQSHGQLYLANKGAFELSVWTLEDSNGGNWSLKHNVSHIQLLGIKYSTIADYYNVISIHPESNVIFTLCWLGHDRSQAKLMSYDMDSRKLSFICDVGWGWTTPFVSYVPSFSEPFADGH